MYKAIRPFTDLQDKDHHYSIGDIFSHKGIKVTNKRLAELSCGDNKQGVAVIELIEESTEESKAKASLE